MDIFACSTCGWERAVIHAPSVYELADGHHIWLRANPAWCHACHDIRSVEQIPDAEAIARELEAARSRNPRAPGVRADRPGTVPHDAEAEVARRAWGERRSSGGRCLTCGSIEVLPFKRCSGAREPVAEMRHPSCGGVLVRTLGF